MNKLLTEEENRNIFESKWPDWKLIEYNGINGPCKVLHNCGTDKTYNVFINLKRRSPVCDSCKEKTNWYWNIGEFVQDLEITNRRALPNTLQEYQYKCKLCGFDCSKPVYVRGKYLEEYWITGHSIKTTQQNGGVGCACCGKKVVQPGINDVATTTPDVVKYFYDKNDANKWSKQSKHKVQIICPVCNTKQPNCMQVHNIVNEGFNCINCGKSISYPEKLMYFLLKSISVDFEMHKVFDWSREVYDEYDKKFHKREYDFYIKPFNTIIEMHGSQHYRDGFSWDSKMSLEYREAIDQQKYNLAQQNGIANYIVIDCRNSNKNYISENVLKSKLADLFDLIDVDWDQISRMALNGIANDIVKDKEKNPHKSTVMLAEEYGVHFSTVITWLKKAGIYDATQEAQNAGLKRSYPVYSPELKKAFRAMKFASQEIGISVKSINSSVIGKVRHAGRHPETGEKLTWEKWTLEQYDAWCESYNPAS